jgi:hypothetical protein
MLKHRRALLRVRDNVDAAIAALDADLKELL